MAELACTGGWVNGRKRGKKVNENENETENEIEAGPDPGNEKETENGEETEKRNSGDREKRSRRKLIILYVCLGVAIAAVLASAAGLGYELFVSKQAENYYHDMSAGVGSHPRELPNWSLSDLSRPSEPSIPSTGPTNEPGGTDLYDPDAEEIIDDIWEPYVDFEALSGGYTGLSGWILSEGTPIDYPIMQWTNNSFFLNHLPDGTKHRSGSIFMDYRNKSDFSDKSTLIYGHESRTGDMFGSLRNYRKQSFYEEHPVIYIFTPKKDYALVLIAGYLLDSGVETPPLKFKDDAAFLAHIANIKKRSFFKSGVEVSADDKIVSLCTCAYDYTNARWIVVGKLVVIGPLKSPQIPQITLE